MPRPFGFQRALDAARGQNLDNQITPRYAPSGRAVTFDLSWYAGGGRTAPTFSGVTAQYIRYVRNNNVVSLWFTIPMTLCTSFGALAWAMSVPGITSNLSSGLVLAPCRGTWEAVQNWNTTRSSVASGPIELLKTSLLGTTYAQFGYLPANPGAMTYVTNAAPWAWATTDLLTGFITYEAADQYTP